MRKEESGNRRKETGTDKGEKNGKNETRERRKESAEEITEIDQKIFSGGKNNVPCNIELSAVVT